MVEHAGHHLGANGALARAPLLPAVSEVGDYQVQATRLAPLQGIGQQQKLYGGFTGGCGLDEEYVVASHILLDLYTQFTVGEVTDLGPAQGDAGAGGHFTGQSPKGSTAEKPRFSHAFSSGFAQPDQGNIPPVGKPI